ncbi:MAG: hypothetical protein KAS72_04000, partial [Phycisphaerales bacterium]|nr:hypothetical protein [Phycisphaerales bacterium]
ITQRRNSLFCTAGIAGVVGAILGLIALIVISTSAGRVRGMGFAVAGLSISIFSTVSGALMLSIMLPALSVARDSAHAVRAEMQLRIISQTSLIYDSEHGQLPPANDWVNVLRDVGSVGDFDTYICWPNLPEQGRAFAMNIHLDSRPWDSVAYPGRTVLFFEARIGSPLAGGPELLDDTPRSRTGYVIVFVDGHTEIVPPSQVDMFVWEP